MTCTFQRYVLGTGAMACKIDRADKLITYTSHIGVCLWCNAKFTLQYKNETSFSICLDKDGGYATNESFKDIFMNENICIRKEFLSKKALWFVIDALVHMD